MHMPTILVNYNLLKILKIVLEQRKQSQLKKYKILVALLTEIDVFFLQIILRQRKLFYLEWILEIELENIPKQKHQKDKSN